MGSEALRRRELLRDLLLRCLADHERTDDARSKRRSASMHRREFVRLALVRKPYLKETEPQLLANVLPGRRLRPERIRPALTICESRRDFDLFDYFSLWSSFPTRDRPGRRFKFLLFDEGQGQRSLMALGCISSSVRQCRAREEWIGWGGPGRLSLRACNLAYVMDLSTCLGIPPYSFLSSGKLLCYVVLSNEVRGSYAVRYRRQRTEKRGRIVEDIALLVTFGAYSSNTAQYKGISINGRSHFKFIGYTKGYSTLQVPQSVYHALITELGDPALQRARSRRAGANPKMRLLREIARILDVDEERVVFSGQRRSVFACPLARNWKEFLHGRASKLDYYTYGMSELVESWRRRWLEKRWSSARTRDKVRAFDPKQLSLLT